MSRSQLWDFRACPRRWLNRQIEDEPTALMTWGSLLDTLLLTPKLFERDYAVAPETYDKEGMKCPQCGSITDAAKCAKCKCEREKVTYPKEWDWNSKACQDWRDEQKKEGKTVVMAKVASEGWTALKRLQEDEEISALIASSKTQVQVNVEWHDGETGLVIPLKCLLDLVPDPGSTWGDSLWDFKTTNDASRKAWQRRIYNDGLDYQGALYMDAINAAIPSAKYRTFGHVIQESAAPYESTMRPLEAEWLDEGRFNYQWDLKQYCKSLTRGKFQGFDREPIGPEVWMLSEKS